MDEFHVTAGRRLAPHVAFAPRLACKLAEEGYVNRADRLQRLLAAPLLLVVTACTPSPRRSDAVAHRSGGPRVTHGIAAGEVTQTSAVIWSRCERAGELHVVLDAVPRGQPIAKSAAALAENDFTAKVTVAGLEPSTSYPYRVWCTAGAGESTVTGDAVGGRFRTAPSPDSPEAVRFVWGGDVGGQNVCRDRTEGYPIFQRIASQDADFFIGLGDMIYADSPCLATGRYGNQQIPGPPKPATDVPEFWAYWKYNRSDEASQQVLAMTPYYAVWDDHEVFDDFGPHHDVGPSPPYPAGRHLLPLGRKAFLDYNPLADPPLLYRTIRWGKHLELFVLDTRSYRDPNSQQDDPRHPKTMLGLEQLRWLKESLLRSDATWKVIVTSVPLSVPTGSKQRGRDGWLPFDQQTGFQYELLDILRFMRAHDIRNNLWISTDIHFVAVFRYAPLPEDPTFLSYEVDTGPLNAGVFPKREFDTTLHPEQLFRYPDDANPAHGFEVAKSWFNYGVMRVDAQGNVHIAVINTSGATLYELSLEPSAERRSGGAKR